VLRELDIWRCAIVKRAAAQISQTDLTPDNLLWLPSPRQFAYRADPFGLWLDGNLHIFVEAFDHRTLKGSIELLVYDENFKLIRQQMVLSKPWHLSYPFVFPADDQIWMLPEARRSGELTLYRARDFPGAWEAAAVLEVPGDAVDATPLYHDDKWWLCYARVGRNGASTSELNLAYADRLTGPWRLHPLNPVRTGLRSTRPAGTPVPRADGGIDLPVQDCSRTYGGSVRRLAIRTLNERQFDAEDLPWLEPAPALGRFVEGLHTLSAADDVTLIDCKLVDRSLLGMLARQRGSLVRRFRTWNPPVTPVLVGPKL
jgi:hypothetical protein